MRDVNRLFNQEPSKGAKGSDEFYLKLSAIISRRTGERWARLLMALLPLIFFLGLALFILRGVLTDPGTIGLFHDWFLGPYPEMVASYANDGNYIFSPNFGYKVYPTDWLFRLFLNLFSWMGGEAVTKGILLVFITLSGVCMYRLGRTLELRYEYRLLLGALYLFTPVIWTRSIAGHAYYLLAYAVAPLLIAFFLEARGRDEKRWFVKSLLAGVVLVLMTTQLQFLIMGLLLLFFLLIFDIKNPVRNLKVILVIVVVALVFQLPWLLPLSQNTSTVSAYAPENLLQYHEVQRSSDVFDTIRLMGYRSQPYSYLSMEQTGAIPPFVPVIAYSIIITSLGCLIFRRDKVTIALSAVMLLGIFLAKGTSPPFADAFIFLFKNTPLFIFREVWHIIFLVVFPAVVLTGIFLQELTDRLGRRWSGTDLTSSVKRTLPSILLATCFIISAGYPLLCGSYFGFIQTYELDGDYQDLMEKFQNDGDIYRVLWVPSMSPVTLPNMTWAGVDPFTQLSPKPTLPVEPSYGNRFGELSAFIASTMAENRTTRFGSFLASLGFEYIVVRNDFTSRYVQFTDLPRFSELAEKWDQSKFKHFLSAQTDLSTVEVTDSYTVYRVDAEASMITVTDQIIHAGSDLSNMYYIANLANLTDYGLLTNHVDGLEAVGTYLTNDDPLDVYPQLVGKVIEPGAYLGGLDPYKAWIDAKRWFWFNPVFASSTNHGAFTLGPNNMAINLDVKQESHILVKALLWNKGGEIETSWNGLGLSTIDTEDRRHILTWADIGTVNGTGTLSLSSIASFNYIDSICVVTSEELEQAEVAIGQVPMVHHYSPSAFHLISDYPADYVPNALKANDTASLDFSPLRGDNYRFMFEGQGYIKIEIGSNEYVVNSTGGKGTSLPIYLAPMGSDVTITVGEDSYLTGFWVFTDNGGAGPFPEADHISINYSAKTPISFTTDQDFGTPILLTLSMPYDGNWRLDIDGSEIKPVQSACYLNGFWINETGDVHIEIKFWLQDHFEMGRAIAIAALLAIATYAFAIYIWPRKWLKP